MDRIKRIRRTFGLVLQENMAVSAHQMQLIGILISLAFLLYYWLGTLWYPQKDSFIGLRLVGSLLGLGLVLSPYWPYALKRFTPGYWFFTLVYVLPFFSFYSFLVNQADDLSSMLLLSSVFFLVLLLDAAGLVMVMALGFLLAIVCYKVFYGALHLGREHAEELIVLLFVAIAGSTVRYKTALLQKQRMLGLATAASMIAHELRSPLLSIKSGAQAVQSYAPILFDAYKKSLAGEVIEKPIRGARLQQLELVTSRICNEVDYANSIIDMLLVKAGQENYLEHCKLELCSMADSVKEALLRYPFRPAENSKLVHFEGDFQFMGSKLLMEHVVFNLLKNALYQIAAMQKGEIRIWTEQTAKANRLIFQDTAKGIGKRELHKIFNQFYSMSPLGTGLGLSFCRLVMNRFGGDIGCESEEGLYTKFTLSFPPVCLNTQFPENA